MIWQGRIQKKKKKTSNFDNLNKINYIQQVKKFHSTFDQGQGYLKNLRGTPKKEFKNYKTLHYKIKTILYKV